MSRFNELLFGLFFLTMTGCVALGMYSGDIMYKICFAFALGCVTLKILNTDYKRSELIICGVIFVLIAGAFVRNHEKTMLLSALAVIGAKDIDIKRILKYTLYVYASCMTATVIMAWSGLIYNGIHELPKGGVNYRIYDFGFYHPNSTYNHLFMVSALLILAYGERLRWFHYAGISTVMYAGYKLLMCRTGWLVYLILLAALYLRFRLRSKRIYGICLGIWTAMPAVLAFFSVLLPYLYRQGLPLARWLDQLVTGRIYLFEKALTEGGIYGYAPIHKIGWIPDNVYLYILLTYGIIMLAVYLTVYTGAMIRLRRAGEDMAVIMLGIVALYGFMEYSVINPTWNPFMLYFSGVLCRERQIYPLDNKEKYDIIEKVKAGR